MKINIPELTLAIASLLLVACGNRKKANAEEPVPEYSVLTIVPRTITLLTDFPATIEGQQNVEIRPKIDGYIEAIYVDEGATVKKGQLLFRISAPQYEQELRTAQADIKIAEADVNAAKMQVSKVRPLVDKKIISRYELEAVQFALQSREASQVAAGELIWRTCCKQKQVQELSKQI